MRTSGKAKPKKDLASNGISEIMDNFICNTTLLMATLKEDNFVHHFYIYSISKNINYSSKIIIDQYPY